LQGVRLMLVEKVTMSRRCGSTPGWQFVLVYAALLMLSLITFSGRTYAQIAGCDEALRPVSTGAGTMTFILALDGLHVPGEIPGLENPKRLAAGLRFKIATNLEALELDQIVPGSGADSVLRTRFHVVACPQRQPLGPGDIGDEAALFLSNGVVLELWGVFDSDEAIFTHAILPFYIHGAGTQVGAGEVFDLAYRYRSGTADETPSELQFLKELLLKSLPLRAYAAAGAAAIALEKKQYDLSRRYFCSARQVLLDLQSENSGLSSDDRRLLEYVDLTSREVIVKALDDADYNGVLGSDLLAPGTECDGSNS